MYIADLEEEMRRGQISEGRKRKDMVNNIRGRYRVVDGERRRAKRHDEKIRKIFKEEKIITEPGENKNNGFRKRKRKNKEKRMEMERDGDRRSKRDKVPGIYITEKRRSRETHKGKKKEGNNSDEENMEYKREN